MMNSVFKITKSLLLEQSSKIDDLRKAITEKLPVSIYYSGPPDEVLSGQRIDILPIVMGPHKKSGNLVIWAFTFKGVSKRGIPNWKMFRIDRIKSLKFNPKLKSFDVNQLPGYIKGKAPGAMKSLARVDVYSPYWDTKKYPVQPPEEKPVPTEIPAPTMPEKPEITAPERPELPPPQEIPARPEEQPIEKPEIEPSRHPLDIYNELKPKITDINGQKIVSKVDYEKAVSDLAKRKEGEWKSYQRMLTGNIRPGEGTRKRFDLTSRKDIDNLLSKDNVKIEENSIENPLSEVYLRFKALIN